MKILTPIVLLLSGCGAIDSCLDNGGSYNYQIGACDYSLSQPGPEEPCLKNVLGKWRVVDFKSPGVSALSAEESALEIGKEIRLEETGLFAGGESCLNPTFESKVFSESEFIDSFRFYPALLGIETGAMCSTTISCELSFEQYETYFLHSRASLLMFREGVFFELQKQ